MNISALVEAVESRFESITETAEGGKDVVTLVSGGEHSEGEIFPLYATSEKESVLLLYGAFCEYINHNKGKTLVWRIKPGIRSFRTFEFDGDQGNQYTLQTFGSEYPTVVSARFVQERWLFIARMRLAIRD